jgi:hypothetical protein
MDDINHGHDRPKAILIAGYYRTGTSALSGALTETGIVVSNDAGANEHNPRGFFETTALIQFDTDVLAALGAVWSDVKFLPEGWVERADIQEFKHRLEKILREKFADAPVFGIKHPHLCRLFPLYQSVIAGMDIDLTVLHTYRSPFEIATSQKKKNNLSRSHALLLWASYVIDAERNARGLPRSWVFYEDLLADPTATVDHALRAIGVDPPNGRTEAIKFVTKALSRSKPVEAEQLYGPVATLVQDVDGAIRHDAAPAVWDNLRQAVVDIAAFLEEVGQSGNRVVNGVGDTRETGMARFGRLATGDKIISHPLRPTERADTAEKARILDYIETSGPVPVLHVIVAIPAGREEAAARTFESIRSSWLQPARVTLVSDATEPPKTEWPVEPCGSDGEMGVRLTQLMLSNPVEPDAPAAEYTAILNAGDTIEPDAIARFSLAIGRGDTRAAAMVYCDEIVALPENPWIRFKPDWNIHRLRESCFVGDWVWYRVADLRRLGGFPATAFLDEQCKLPKGTDYRGAEEYAYQLMLHEHGLRGMRIPEALFVRAPESRRDAVPLKTALGNAIAAIDRHLGRCGVNAKARNAVLPGTFELDFEVDQTPENGIVIGLECAGFEMPQVHETSGRHLKAMGPHDTLVYLDVGAAAPVSVRTYLDRIVNEVVPRHRSIAVLPAAACIGATIATLLAKATEMGARYIGLMTPGVEPSRDDWFDVMRRRMDASPDCAMIGPRHHFDDGAIARLIGPVLFGSPSRIGNGRDAQNPGPGGWLAATQPASTVQGPGVLIRVEALRRSAGTLDGVESWADLGEILRQDAATVLWCPSLAMRLPGAPVADTEVRTAAGKSYDAAIHHPALSVIGDPLLSEARFGLIAQAPRMPHQNLLSGGSETHVLHTARTLRKSGHCSASWAAEPLDPYSVNRLPDHHWIRINPDHLFDAARGFVGIWTKPPGPGQHKVVKAATRCFGTSDAIVRLLSGMGAKRLDHARPFLSEAVWKPLDFAALPPADARIRVIWVDESGTVPDLVHAIIAETADRLSWIVVSDSAATFPGSVTVIKRPLSEDGWAALFHGIRPLMLFRPTCETPWRDRHAALMAAAGGAAILQGQDLESPGDGIAMHVVSHDTKSAWLKALGRLCFDRSLDLILADAAKAREDVLRVAPWVEANLDAAAAWADVARTTPASRVNDCLATIAA